MARAGGDGAIPVAHPYNIRVDKTGIQQHAFAASSAGQTLIGTGLKIET